MTTSGVYSNRTCYSLCVFCMFSFHYDGTRHHMARSQYHIINISSHIIIFPT